jgi:hypothetical protein
MLEEGDSCDAKTINALLQQVRGGTSRERERKKKREREEERLTRRCRGKGLWPSGWLLRRKRGGEEETEEEGKGKKEYSSLAPSL